MVPVPICPTRRVGALPCTACLASTSGSRPHWQPVKPCDIWRRDSTAWSSQRAYAPPAGTGNTWVLVDFDRDPGDDPGQNLEEDWPDDMRSLRLVLAEHRGEETSPTCGPTHTAPIAPDWDPPECSTIYLPKGHVARLRYASFVHDRLVGHFGLPGWHDDEGAQTLRAEAMAGANWMLTPWRSLTLVHATQQPLCPPEMAHVTITREAGDQFADLLARRVTLHGPSTGKFEIIGEWEEWIDDPLNDDPEAPGPRRVSHTAQLTEIRLAENHANVFALEDVVRRQAEFTPVDGQPDTTASRQVVPGNRHEFGDTRFRFVRYHLRATTRFREYLPAKLFAETQRITRDGPEVAEDRIDTRALPRPNLRRPEERQRARQTERDPGAPDPRGRRGRHRYRGAFERTAAGARDCLCRPYLPLGSQRAGGGNSAECPQWEWSPRVLERPWFSSGDGELLGVVIPSDGTRFDQISPELIPYVTQWGCDPIWESGMPSTQARRLTSRFGGAPRRADSAGRRRQSARGGPSGALRASAKALVLRHRTQSWAPVNMPFVRLALTRYQPNAIAGAAVSRVVLAEFAQVLPRRRTVLQREHGCVTVNVYGPVPDRGPMRWANAGGAVESEYTDASVPPLPGSTGELGRNRMELVLQTRPAEIDSISPGRIPPPSSPVRFRPPRTWRTRAKSPSVPCLML